MIRTTDQANSCVMRHLHVKSITSSESFVFEGAMIATGAMNPCELLASDGAVFAPTLDGGPRAFCGTCPVSERVGMLALGPPPLCAVAGIVNGVAWPVAVTVDVDSVIIGVDVNGAVVRTTSIMVLVPLLVL